MISKEKFLLKSSNNILFVFRSSSNRFQVFVAPTTEKIILLKLDSILAVMKKNIDLHEADLFFNFFNRLNFNLYITTDVKSQDRKYYWNKKSAEPYLSKTFSTLFSASSRLINLVFSGEGQNKSLVIISGMFVCNRNRDTQLRLSFQLFKE